MRVAIHRPPAASSIESQRVFLGPAPGPGYVFIPGYYSWAGGAYTWVQPAWAVPPDPGAVWVTPNWMENDGGWELQEGYWSAPADDASADAPSNAADPEPVASADDDAKFADIPAPPPPPDASAIVQWIRDNPQPARGYVFIPGYYFWNGNDYEWIPNAWSLSPWQGARWVTPRYVRQDGRWVFQDGYWR